MKTLKVSKAIKSLMAVAFAAISGVASAVPALQLDILGGVYNTATQTTVATSDSFSLYAYMSEQQGKLKNSSDTWSTKLTDTYFLSAALLGSDGRPIPQSGGGDFGFFTINGTRYNATENMFWGTPPVESSLAVQNKDSGDLQPHSVFPTYFNELSFAFTSGNNVSEFNTVTGETGNGQMYYKLFNVDLSGLSVGLTLHFDLYNEEIKKCISDIDIEKFSPFSHDAEGSKVSPVPLPAAAWLFGSALFGFIAMSNRRKI